MKIILEDHISDEVEILIRGDISSKTVQHILALLKSTSLTSKIILYDDTKEVLYDIKEIIYFEVIDRKTYARTHTKRYICKYNLQEILAMFKRQGIQQVGKSILVNTSHVLSLEAEFSGNYTTYLSNDEKIIVSRFYMKEFRKAIMEG